MCSVFKVSKSGYYKWLVRTAPQYPHNSPYVFAENSVIAGIELEGLEFLNKEDAMLELRNGEVHLKVENSFRSAKIKYNHNQGRASYRSDGSHVLGFDSLIGTYSIQGIDPEKLISNQTPQISPDVSKPPSNVFTDELNAYRVNTGFKKIKNGRVQDRIKNDINFSGMPPSPGMVRGAASAFAVGCLIEISSQYQIFASAIEMNDINKQGGIISTQVIQALENAINMGIIDKKVAVDKFDDLVNVILFGGNGNEGKEITELGLKIYNEAREEAIIEKNKTNLVIKKAVKESKSEYLESVKVQDNTKLKID